ncbi:MAG: hypothetical protein ABR552_04395 [Actinomycetota bacterium]|nr:hypothetical protein [Actinomycetota bacterium]
MTERKDEPMPALVIDCQRCLEGDQAHRDDCLVAFIIDRPEGAIVFDVEEERALRSLRDGGLLPKVRLDRRTG